VRARFSPVGVEADDVVIDLVGRIPVATPVVVVSSDKRVREGARRAGANLLHARQLLALLGR
jgi:rRNA-processing protein FCF1